MAHAASAMAGDPPWPWFPMRPLGIPEWYPWSWDAPSDPKAFAVTLNGQEETYIIGLFVFVWDARRAAAKALLAYRRWWRRPEMDDDSHRPRGTHLHARVQSYVIDRYAAPWWEAPESAIHADSAR